MNITQVYLIPDCDTEDSLFRGEYQNQVTYLQLFIEDCLRKNKVDRGEFNRLVFSEGSDGKADFCVVGNNALHVSITKSHDELKNFKSDRDFHNYFVRKFFEGFRKFDAHFATTFETYLAPLIAEKYRNKLTYEKKMAAKRLPEIRLQAIGVYSKNSYTLEIRVFKGNTLLKSEVVYECLPDMWIAKYNVNKVKITEEQIEIINRVRKITKLLQIKDII